MTCYVFVSRPPFGTRAMWVGDYILLMYRNLLLIYYAVYDGIG